MGIRVVATIVCDGCGEKVEVVTEEAEFWWDYMYEPPVGWDLIYPGPYDSKLLCGICLGKEVKDE